MNWPGPQQVNEDHRAINGPLAKVTRGQPQTALTPEIARSDALPGTIAPLPKLIVQVGRSGWRQAEGARVLAGLISGDGPLSARIRPSSLKPDCDRRTTTYMGGKCLVNVHAKSRLILEPLCGHSGQKTKGQAGACPDRTRAIPCTVRAVTGQFPGTVVRGRRSVEHLAYALRACPRDAPASPSAANDHHQQQLVNLKLAPGFEPATNARDTLVMRSSAAPLPVLGPGGPAVRVGLPPDDLG
jgi:hypothetical protein